MRTYEGGEQVPMFDADPLCLRTSTDWSPQTTEKTSGPSSKRWQGSRKTGFMYLNLQTTSGEGGAMRELLSAAASRSHGASTTLVYGESPREGVASLFSPTSMGYLPRRSCLSEILEEDPDPKYTLSAKACLGILRRAVRRGKIQKMPEILVKALERQSGVLLSEITLTEESCEKNLSASTLAEGETDSPCSLKESDTGKEPKSSCLNPWDIQSKHIISEDGIAEALYAGECRYGDGEAYVMQTQKKTDASQIGRDEVAAGIVRADEND